MFPRFHRLPPPAASPAAGLHRAVGGIGAISRVPRFASAFIDRPTQPEAAADTRGALCNTLTQIVDTFAAQGKDPQPPTALHVGIGTDGSPPARTPRRRAPLQANPRSAIAGP